MPIVIPKTRYRNYLSPLCWYYSDPPEPAHEWSETNKHSLTSKKNAQAEKQNGKDSEKH